MLYDSATESSASGASFSLACIARANTIPNGSKNPFFISQLFILQKYTNKKQRTITTYSDCYPAAYPKDLFYLCGMTHNTSNNSPGTSVFDCIVIGGGISGISFAYQAANSGDSVLVLEAEKSVGGQIDTFAPKRYPDFWTELGAHTCYNSYTRLLSIVTDSALQRDLLPLDKCSYILHNGRHLKSVASQLSYLPLIAHGWRMFSFSREGKTVKQAFRPVVGASNYDKLFRRLFRAVICQDADEYPAVFFLKKRKERNKEMPRKYSFSKGLSSLLQAMTEKGGFSVRTNSGAAKVTLADGIYSVETSAGG
ncbi:MAG TPA: hypothetical protein DIC46_08540, partial [Porphyromonadaceae bacterium]|nr:hypothetical protein [Porphyromonadaceae bacterium]